MKHVSVILIALLSSLAVYAQNDSFEQFRRQQQAGFNQFKQDKQSEFDAFRKRINEQYAAMMEKQWEAFHGKEQPVPEEPKVVPVQYEEPAPAPVKPAPKEPVKQSPAPAPVKEEPAPTPTPVKEEPKPTPTPVKEEPKPAPAPVKEEPKPAPQPEPDPAPAPAPEPEVKDNPIPVQPVVAVVPDPEPAPEPIAPVEVKEEEPFKTANLSFYGTQVKIGWPDPDGFKLGGVDEKQLAAAWKQLADNRYDVTINNALAARKDLNLCDWAYLRLIQQAAEEHYGKTNEAVFAEVFLLTQSGYRVRMAYGNNKLHLLIASNYDIFSMPYFTIDGHKFYAVEGHAKDLHICPAAYEKEKNLSLQIAQVQKLASKPTQKRTLTSKKGVTASISVNNNLIDFFNKYPQACLSGDQTTRWAAYANTPIENSVKAPLYKQLKNTIGDLSEKEAVSVLLNWVQTAFVYEYDDKVWGGDRAFFAQETLYYPYCDCEDRSILFSRLVRDLVGLDVVLLYYPGHLATAVAFKDDVKGDYLTYKNQKYVVCDPTYINAPVGRTMPGMDNNKAKVIALKK